MWNYCAVHCSLISETAWQGLKIPRLHPLVTVCGIGEMIQKKTVILRVKHTPLSLCPLQIPHQLPRSRWWETDDWPTKSYLSLSKSLLKFAQPILWVRYQGKFNHPYIMVVICRRKYFGQITPHLKKNYRVVINYHQPK